MAPSALHLVFLSELSLPQAFWLAVTGQRVCLIDLPPVFPALPLLAAARKLLCQFPRVKPVLDAEPRLADLKELRVPRHHDDPFRIIEPWMDSHIGHDRLDTALGADAMPFRQVSCNYIFGYFDRLFYLNWFCQAYTPGEATVVGADEVLLGMYERLYGRPPSLVRSTARAGRRLLNPLMILIAAMALVVTALRGIRLVSAKPREVLLGSDFSGDDRDPLIWGDTRAAGAEVAVVFRSRRQKAENMARIAPLPVCAPGDGHFSLGQAFAEILRGLASMARIYRQARYMTPGHLHRLSLIPLKRLQVRKLFTLYRFRKFWVRDDYNVEHILRSQELRAIGGTSIGIQHGLPISAALIPQWRYVDCDIYYVFGLGILKHYGDRWPGWMQIKACGSLGMTREREARLPLPRPPDIIFQAKAERTAEPLIEALDVLATAFPDRTIHVQIKKTFSHTFLAQAVLDAASRYPNTVCTSERIYDLFLKSRYLITDPSTVGAEAIQFGLYSFMLDYDGRKSLYFRDFPEFCLTDPHEAVNRIRGIEDGNYHYRLEDYEPLIARHGRAYDQVLTDLGLASQARK